MASETYGRDTGTAFSTYQEFLYILDERKPFVLVKSESPEDRASGRRGPCHSPFPPLCSRLMVLTPLLRRAVCDEWQEPHVRLALGKRTLYTEWQPGSPIPTELVASILQKARNSKAATSLSFRA